VGVEALGRPDRETDRAGGELPQGQYANHFEVGHNAVEFVLDFGQLYADSPGARIHTRIITSPTYAHDLLELLQKSIDEYRRGYGPITGRA